MVAGVRSPYSEVGPSGSREAVVFVHGNPGPATDWSDLLECVAEFARGIAMDFPGYGTADRPRHFDYSVNGYARYLDGALALVIWGEADAYLPLEQAELQQRAFPSAQIVTLPNTGHWAMHERPDDLRAIVLPFLRAQILR